MRLVMMRRKRNERAIPRNLRFSHREWRKIAKRERRRRIRVKNAIKVEECEKQEEIRRQSSPTYIRWQQENEKLEALRIVEEDRIRQEGHQKWLETEVIAQKQWVELQAKIAKAKQERVERDIRIKEEWDREQLKLKESREQILRAKIEREEAQREMEHKMSEYLNGAKDIPQELLVVLETKPNAELCPFHSKTGVCRFGDDCSRNHRKPTVGKILLAQNFYTNFSLEHSKPNEYDTDIGLEYDEADSYLDYKAFFLDVLPEFEKFGEVVQFKVCRNRERHLRGNTYIEYARTRSAIKAHRAMHTRWYGGRQVSLQFCLISSWKSAICGLANGNRCPKGLSCNFLHVFRNPGQRFDNNIHSSRRSSSHTSSAPRRSNPSPTRSERRRRNESKNWRWSESPEPERKSVKRSRKDKKSSRDRDKKDCDGVKDKSRNGRKKIK